MGRALRGKSCCRQPVGSLLRAVTRTTTTTTVGYAANITLTLERSNKSLGPHVFVASVGVPCVQECLVWSGVALCRRSRVKPASTPDTGEGGAKHACGDCLKIVLAWRADVATGF